MRRVWMLSIALGCARPVTAQTIDSVLPMEEEIRRFDASILAAPSRLEGGARSRDGLVARFVRALETGDTSRLAAMLIDRAEFARLYYRTSRYAQPPYRQKPSLVWFLMTSRSSRGIGRVLARDGGRPLGVRGYRCRAAPAVEGRNRIWSGCELVVAGGRTRRLFGAILERDGRFKFLSYDSEY